jgi:hypothetical protein
MRALLVALGLLLAVTWIGGGYALYYVIRDDDAWSKKAAAEAVQLADASRKYAQLQAQKTAVDGELQATKSDLRHPTLGIWNVSETISGPTAYLTGGMPDTFTYHLKFTSDTPVTVTYMTSHDFAAAIRCVEVGSGTSHTCFGRSGKGWYDVTTTLSVDIHEAEGCADYLVIFTAARAATVHPDVSVTYNPAPAATGACATG